jgi:CxxC motif-containing protein (DUF1111 family)
MVGLRPAPPLIGLGLLEDTGTDYRRCPSARRQPAFMAASIAYGTSQGKTVLGRFGLKANHGSVREQVAAAFINDIGSAPGLSANCPPIRRDARNSWSPASRLNQAGCNGTLRPHACGAGANRPTIEVQHGEQLFGTAQCAQCHMPELKTGEFGSSRSWRADDSSVHRLVAARHGARTCRRTSDFLAGGSEWRAPPLGNRLVRTVNGASGFMHGGRARNFTEAIMWHGGEADASRQAFSSLARADRALIAFSSPCDRVERYTGASGPDIVCIILVAAYNNHHTRISGSLERGHVVFSRRIEALSRDRHATDADHVIAIATS